MTHVFVSYTRSNAQPVSRIAAALLETGYQVWWDHRLQAHQDFGLEIEAALRDARCAVVAWSTEARNSLWVRAEATEAWETGKLVQVSLDGARPPLPFTMIQVLNLSSWSGRTGDPPWSDLEDSVRSVMGGEARTAPTPRERPARLGGFAPAAVIGGASLGLVLLAAGVVAVGVTGFVSANLFSVLTRGMFLVALLAFAHMLIRIINIAMASR
jgi:TIR domain